MRIFYFVTDYDIYPHIDELTGNKSIVIYEIEVSAIKQIDTLNLELHDDTRKALYEWAEEKEFDCVFKAL